MKKIQEFKKKYLCIKDLQGTEWCVGYTDTAINWKKCALEWASSDNNTGVYWYIYKHKADKELMDFIANFWDIELREVE